MITMVLGGLWHGASWTFVVWGALHGALLVAHRGVKAAASARPRLEALLASAPGTVLRWGTTTLCVLVGWVFFRSQTFGQALEVLRRLAVPSRGMGPPLHDVGLWGTVAVMAAAHVIGARKLWPALQQRLPSPVLGAGYAAALALALLLAPMTGKAFIYFQF
jgi:alginate O-acetyltransferase complex protein AlgI